MFQDNFVYAEFTTGSTAQYVTSIAGYMELLNSLDKRHVTSYSIIVIKSFADKHTRKLFITGKSRRIQPDLLRRAVRRLEFIDLATCLDDLKVPPSNRLHALKGHREGLYAISINDQWRICFRFQDGDAYDVEITDYH